MVGTGETALIKIPRISVGGDTERMIYSHGVLTPNSRIDFSHFTFNGFSLFAFGYSNDSKSVCVKAARIAA